MRDSAPGSAAKPLGDLKQMPCPPWSQFPHLCDEAISLVQEGTVVSCPQGLV